MVLFLPDNLECNDKALFQFDCSPNPETQIRICGPKNPSSWEKLMQSHASMKNPMLK